MKKQLKVQLTLLLITWCIHPFAQPSLHIKNKNLSFAPVIEGTEIVHDFTVTNNGNSPLIIKKVTPTCGCYTVSYDKEIAPLSKGIISVKLQTKGYGNKTLHKKVNVLSNDPKNEYVVLTISGFVETFISLKPSYVYFEGKVNEEIRTNIEISRNAKYPFRISDSYITEFNSNINFSIHEKPEKYIVNIKGVFKKPEFIRSKIILSTNNLLFPEIVIKIIGRIMEK